MEDEAPRVFQVPGGLFRGRASRSCSLARALLVSLLLHALTLAVGNFPNLSIGVVAPQLHGRLTFSPAANPAAQTEAPTSKLPPRRPEGLRRQGPSTRALPSGRGQEAGLGAVQRMSVEEAGTVDAASLSAYRLAIARQARPLKRRLAEQPVTGEGVELLMVLQTLPGRSFPVVSLRRGTGEQLIDELALALIEQAVRLTPLPEKMRGHRWQFEMLIQIEPDS